MFDARFGKSREVEDETSEGGRRALIFLTLGQLEALGELLGGAACYLLGAL